MTQSRTKKVVLLSFGRLLSTLMALAAMAVLARVLTTHDFATYNQVIVVHQLVSPLLMMGLSQTLLFFLPGETRRVRAVLVENLLLLGGMGAAFSLFLLFGGNRLIASLMNNPLLAGALWLFVPYAVLVLPAHAIDACLTSRNRVNQLVVYNLSSRIVGFLLIAVACLVWRSLGATVMATVLGAAIALGPALWLMFRACDEGEWRPRLSSMMEMMKYSVPLGIGNTLTGMAFAMDKFLVSALCTPEQFAVYVLGATEIPLIGIIVMSVIAVITPEMAASYKQGRVSDVVSLWNRATLKCGTLMLPLMGLLLVVAPEIVTVLFSAKYAGSAYPLRVYALLIPLRTVSFSAIFTAMDSTKMLTAGGGLMLAANLVAALCLIPWIGPTGAAWATVLSCWMMGMFYLHRISKNTGIPLRNLIPWGPLARMLGLMMAAAIPAMVILWLLPQVPWLRLIVGSLVYGSVVAALYVRSGLVDLQDYVRRFFKSAGVNPSR
jgi:O-antigen/teichoic acid export membrane protein